jgi:DNA-binding IclR family transcriptional regulator
MSKVDKNTDRPSIDATETSLSIVEAIQDADGATVSELADCLPVAKSTIYSHLCTLEDRGYVVREGTTYHVGFQFLHHGEYVRSRKPAYRLAAETLPELADLTGEETDFSVANRGRIIRLVQERVHHEQSMLGDRMTGSYDLMHNTASGKAILAHYSRDRVEAILDEHGLPATTPQTITDRETLFEELARIEDCGYAINDEESIQGLRCVSVAATDPTGTVVGAFSVSGPAYRTARETLEGELSTILRNIVEDFEQSLARYHTE